MLEVYIVEGIALLILMQVQGVQVGHGAVEVVTQREQSRLLLIFLLLNRLDDRLDPEVVLVVHLDRQQVVHLTQVDVVVLVCQTYLLEQVVVEQDLVLLVYVQELL